MVEELQAILNLLGDVTGIAAWVLGGFIVYKSVIYLSTAGMVYALVRLFITKAHDLFSKMSESKIAAANSPEKREYFDVIKDLTCGEGVAEGLISLMKQTRAHTSRDSISRFRDFFDSDLRFMRDAVEEKMAREKED